MAELSYFWHGPVWRQLEAYLAQDRLPHALMLHGPRGIGKRHLAYALAERVLCEHGRACGRCPSCNLLTAGNHPDLLTLVPEPGKPLTVDRIRELIDALTLTPQYQRGRIVIIEAADRMNPAAANSFLKTLEEPAPDTVILLLCEQPSLLPATILSRCQRLQLTLPPLSEAEQWLVARNAPSGQARLALALNGGAPLAAAAWLDSDAPQRRRRFLKTLEKLLAGRGDPVVLAGEWQDEPLEQLVDWLLTVAADLVRLRYDDNGSLINTDCQGWLQDWARRLDLRQVFHFWQRLLNLRQVLQTQLNRTLLLESLFLQIDRLRHEQTEIETGNPVLDHQG